jgi:hypothetical protein
MASPIGRSDLHIELEIAHRAGVLRTAALAAESGSVGQEQARPRNEINTIRRYQMKRQISIIVVLSTVFSIGLAACGKQVAATPAPTANIVSSNNVVAEGRLKPIQGTNLSFQARGLVETVLVKAGDPVKQGDVLVRLSNANVPNSGRYIWMRKSSAVRLKRYGTI